MASSTISTTVTSTVLLGSANYPSPLTITGSGAVTPSFYGAPAVLATAQGVRLLNEGSLTGGFGDGNAPHQVDGGIGVDLTSGGDALTNLGTITGGASYDRFGGFPNFPVSPYAKSGFSGGDGVDLTRGTLHNAGKIAGGASVYSFFAGGSNGGNGVNLDGGLVSNNGTIIGGEAAYSGPFLGGAGIMAHGTENTIHNNGIIAGGIGGYGGEETDPEAGLGGAGIDLTSGGSLFNSGTITGGIGGSSDGAGAYAASGGAGVMLGAGQLDNRGYITGGSGGSAAFANQYQGAGGIGVDLLAGSTLANSGTITGGLGGNGFYVGGGPGGTGVYVSANAALVNRGLIVGGSGHADGGGYGGYGGAGVILNGGTLRNFGTIEGGPGGSGKNGNGTQGVAVQFGTLASTLILEPGATFLGQVLANAAAGDTLRLAGTAGTLTDLGTQLAGFINIVNNAGASWTLMGTNILDAGAGLRDLGDLSLTGTLTGGALLIGNAGSLSVSGSLGASTVHFAAGGGGTLAIGTAGAVSSTLTGFGSGDTIDIGKVATTLTFSGGTLTLENGSSIVETLALAGGYTAANFHLAPDEQGGTAISFVPTPAASLEPAAARSIEPEHWGTGLIVNFHAHT